MTIITKRRKRHNIEFKSVLVGSRATTNKILQMIRSKYEGLKMA